MTIFKPILYWGKSICHIEGLDMQSAKRMINYITGCSSSLVFESVILKAVSDFHHSHSSLRILLSRAWCRALRACKGFLLLNFEGRSKYRICFQRRSNQKSNEPLSFPRLTLISVSNNVVRRRVLLTFSTSSYHPAKHQLWKTNEISVPVQWRPGSFKVSILERVWNTWIP